MRVSHVITRLIVGGAQENTIASVLGLRSRKDLQVDLISGPTTGPEGSLASTFDGLPGALTIIPELIRPVRPFQDWRALARLTALFARTHPHIVHTHSGKAGVLGRLAAHRAGVPVIIHTIHGPSFGDFQGALANFIFRAAERRAARVTTHFITVAQAMADQYLAAGIGKPENYTRIFSGFDLQPFLAAQNDLALRKRHGLGADDFVVGKIARLFELKGHDDLLDVAPAVIGAAPKVKFLLIGGGEWRQRLEARARGLGIASRFVFTGLVKPSEIPGLVGCMDVLVHLSRREGLARALPQALAAARPVVCYDCDGAREACQDGKTGFLVKPGDLPTLHDRLLQLVRNAIGRQQMGATGQQFVRDRFSVEQMVGELDRLYRRLAGEHGVEMKFNH